MDKHLEEQREEAPVVQEHTLAADNQYNITDAMEQAHADTQQQHVAEHAEATAIADQAAADKHQQEQREEAQDAQEHSHVVDKTYNTMDVTAQARADILQTHAQEHATTHVIQEADRATILRIIQTH